MGFIFHSELVEMRKALQENNKKGKEHYVKKEFDGAIAYFSKSLDAAKICHVAGSVQLIRSYYNLGASYHENKELEKAKNALLIAQNMSNNAKKSKAVKGLLEKISRRLAIMDEMV